MCMLVELVCGCVLKTPLWSTRYPRNMCDDEWGGKIEERGKLITLKHALFVRTLTTSYTVA